MKEYTVSFLFNSNLSKVLLIKKNRPEKFKGLFNGVGGKVEEDEEFIDSATREIKEETGLIVNTLNHVATLINGNKMSFFEDNVNDDQILVYAGFANIDKAKKTTDEEIEIIEVNNLPRNIVPNLSYLIPLCINKLNGKENLVTVPQFVYHELTGEQILRNRALEITETINERIAQSFEDFETDYINKVIQEEK